MENMTALTPTQKVTRTGSLRRLGTANEHDSTRFGLRSAVLRCGREPRHFPQPARL